MNRRSWAMRRSGWTSSLALGALMLAGGFALGGCPAPVSDNGDGAANGTTQMPCPPRDETAKLVTIQPDLVIEPPVVRLSQGNKEGVQWHNVGDESVTILLPGAPVGIVVEPRSFSPVHHVHPTIAYGPYHYDVVREAGGPPGPPQIDVGP